MMSDQDPHPGYMRHSQIPLAARPPTHRLDIDNCINYPSQQQNLSESINFSSQDPEARAVHRRHIANG